MSPSLEYHKWGNITLYESYFSHDINSGSIFQGSFEAFTVTEAFTVDNIP